MKIFGIKLTNLLALVFGLALSTTLISTSITSAAQEGESITISPTKKIYNLDAGSVLNDEVTIINDGDTDFTFKIYGQPYSVTDEDYEPDFASERSNADAYKWVAFEKDSYFVKAGQMLKIKYTISVPKNAAPGGHYGAIFAETQPKKNVTGTSIQHKQRVGALVYATIKGTYEISGKVSKTDIPFMQFKAPLYANTFVENTGNTDFNVSTVTGVQDVFGKMKFSETKEHRVLPGTTRKIESKWDKSGSFGLYKLTTTSSFLDKNVSKSSYVLMAPLSYYMIFVVGLLIAVIVFVSKRR